MDQKTGIVRLFTSSKGLAILLAMLGVVVLMLARVDPAPFADFAWKVVSAYVLGTSVQDAANNLAQRPRAEPPTLSVTNNIPSLMPPAEK